jgi:putative transcriptional regulator
LLIDKLRGQLLITPPFIKSGFWAKTVVLVTEHKLDNSTGLIINKPSQVSIQEFGKQLGFDLRYPGYVQIGGPINIHNLILLHTSEWSSDNTLQINDTFSISSSEDILPRLANKDHPAKWRILMGLCGWDSNQLEDEIDGTLPQYRNTSWCVTQANTELVFNSNSTVQWNKSIDCSAIEFTSNYLF